jgi:DNA-directed RNA polymerase specialized sigma24 family protein
VALGDKPLSFEEWEEATIRYWCSRVKEPTEQEDLTAELRRKLLLLRAEHRRGIRYPKAYVRTAIGNAAKTWLKRRSTARRELPLEYPPLDAGEQPIVGELDCDEGDFGIALHSFWEDLEPELQRFLAVLEEKKGNLSAAAKNLRIHRNTAALWRAKIRAAARKHGLGG